jgi:ABC-2 type transport system permease protein
MIRRLQLEWALLWRGTAAPRGVALLLVAGLFALQHGETVIGRQEAALAGSQSRQTAQQSHILSPLPASAIAGDQFYYLEYHTERHPSPWARLVIGQRDVQAFNLKIRLLALQGQLYASDLGHPLLASLGQFDLAFVIVVLAPLLLIALTYNLWSGEAELGTWPLLQAQPTAPWRVLALRAVLRLALVWLPIVSLLLASVVIAGVPIDLTWGALAAASGAYLVVWLAAVLLVTIWRRPSEVNLLLLLGLWVFWTALGPALVSVAAASRFPLPESLELTVLQRQGYHGAWDEPLPAVMEAFYQRYPEWRGRDVPADRYSNAWYYAMQERGDAAARDAAGRYRQSLEARDHWVQRVSWLLPPAALQQWLMRQARTDLQAHLAYLDSVAAYHETLKRVAFPMVFDDRLAAAVDWAAFPKHRHDD